MLLDVPVACGLPAAGADSPADRLEAEGDAFQQRVADGFRSLAAEDPTPWLVVDGTGPVEVAAASVEAVGRSRVPGAAMR